MDKFIVGTAAARPAGKPDECFYCNQPVGGEHKPECVCIVRKVRVRVSAEIDIWRPADWDLGMVEFHLDESSWCSTNIIDEIAKYGETLPNGCLCQNIDFEVLNLTDERKVSDGG